MKNKAFTLIEVIFAIVILSSSLVVLLGLQSSVISKSLRDRNQTYAMLIGRNILAALEMEKEIEEQDTTETAYQLLKDLDGIDKDDPEEQELYNGMYVNLKVEEWENPPEVTEKIDLLKPLLKRIYMRVFWGETPEDQMEIVYFRENER